MNGLRQQGLSKYKIAQATRYQLPIIPEFKLRQWFNFKRCILAAELPIQGGKSIIVLNTHLDAFAQGTTALQDQINMCDKLVSSFNQLDQRWILGGDFNALAPGGLQYKELKDGGKVFYQPPSPIITLFDHYPGIPTLSKANGPERRKWYTHYSNRPLAKGPDKTIDYIFYSNSLKLISHQVRQSDTLHISDHLPLIGSFQL